MCDAAGGHATGGISNILARYCYSIIQHIKASHRLAPEALLSAAQSGLIYTVSYVSIPYTNYLCVSPNAHHPRTQDLPHTHCLANSPPFPSPRPPFTSMLLHLNIPSVASRQVFLVMQGNPALSRQPSLPSPSLFFNKDQPAVDASVAVLVCLPSYDRPSLW